MCVSVFWWWGEEEGKCRVCEKGGRSNSFCLWPRLASPYLARHWEWGEDEDWALKTEDFWALKISSWTLYPTGEEEKDLIFLCVWEVPAGERGDIGVVAMCNNQIPFLMFDNWIFKPHQFLFLFWPTFEQADKNSKGVKEYTIETDIPNLNHWNYFLACISHSQNIRYSKRYSGAHG